MGPIFSPLALYFYSHKKLTFRNSQFGSCSISYRIIRFQIRIASPNIIIIPLSKNVMRLGFLHDILRWIVFRMGMEVNNSKFNQRRTSMIKFLGELYNYRIVDSSLIFKVWHCTKIVLIKEGGIFCLGYPVKQCVYYISIFMLTVPILICSSVFI